MILPPFYKAFFPRYLFFFSPFVNLLALAFSLSSLPLKEMRGECRLQVSFTRFFLLLFCRGLFFFFLPPGILKRHPPFFFFPHAVQSPQILSSFQYRMSVYDIGLPKGFFLMDSTLFASPTPFFLLFSSEIFLFFSLSTYVQGFCSANNLSPYSLQRHR